MLLLKKGCFASDDNVDDESDIMSPGIEPMLLCNKPASYRLSNGIAN
jgi:hypothetical protein